VPTLGSLLRWVRSAIVEADRQPAAKAASAPSRSRSREYDRDADSCTLDEACGNTAWPTSASCSGGAPVYCRTTTAVPTTAVMDWL